MKLLLVRHGNTFAPGQEAFMVGSMSDLELVERGVEQAKEIALALQKNTFKIKAIYSSPLKRTAQTAQIIAEALKFDSSAIRYEEALKEFDFGKWEGLTSKEIATSFGEEELDAWNKHSVWPASAGFIPNESEARIAIKNFTNKLESGYSAQDLILVVSSNGKLRYFLDLVRGEFEKRINDGSFKMGTGHLSLLSKNSKDWVCEWWNISPQNANF